MIVSLAHCPYGSGDLADISGSSHRLIMNRLAVFQRNFLEPTKACLRATIRDASAGTISHKVKAVKILWFGRRPPVVVVAMSVLFGCARCRDDCRGLVQKLDGKVKLVTPARNESARQSPAIPFPDTLNP